MSDLNTRCLEAFPEWLKSLPTDATELVAVLEDTAVAEPVRKHAASALNYLFKSLDLIPDGIEDLGFLDDAFVLRVASKLALTKLAGGEGPAILSRLAPDSALIEELLGEHYPRLERYVDGLLHAAARGRTTDELVESEEARGAFIAELRAWASGYQTPGFAKDEKNIVKLQSFLSAKLPS